MQKHSKIVRTAVIATAFLCLLVWLIWSNLSLEVTEYNITSSNIPDSFNGYRIVQISDLHNAQFGKDNHRLLSKIRDLDPDIIVITGDLIDRRRTNVDISIAFIEAAAGIVPTYYVPGNHERQLDGLENIYDRISHAGAKLMLEENLLLQRDQQFIRLSGIPDTSFYPENRFADAVKQLLPDDEIYTILLSHQPQDFPAYVDAGADLVLTGHAHGGQIRLPYLGGLISLTEGLFPKYDDGIHVQDDTTMIISRGLGQTVIPIRINNRPEIVVVTLENTK